MPKIDIENIESSNRTGYPHPFNLPMDKRHVRRLGPASGLSDFGVSHVMLEPGGISSQRHWHEQEDEFLVLIEGEAVLVEEGTETVLRPGDCAAFPKGVPNGHHLVNRSDAPCTFIAVGKPAAGVCHYSDIDLHIDESLAYVHKDGTPY